MKRQSLGERWMLLLGAGLLVVDQLVKWMVYRWQPSLDAVLFRMHLVHNTGASFGMLQGQNALFIWVSIIALGAFMLYYDRLETEYQQWGFVVMAGVVSNLVDRVLRGGVVDYIDLGWFPVFNIADVLIVGGIAVICMLMVREDLEKSGRRKRR